MDKKALTVTLIFHTILLVGINANRGDYGYLSFGNYCGLNAVGHPAPCNFEALLECNIQGICRCIEPRIMTYNGSTCAVLGGESCFPSDKVWLLDNVTKFQREDYVFPCVPNATCNLFTSLCQCLPDYYLGIDRNCHPKLHEARCRTKEDCEAESTHLICNRRKTCGCNDDLSILFNEEQICRGIVGAPCDNFGKRCVPNAECSGSSWNTKECRCKLGFSKSPDGRCLVAYNNECSKEPGRSCNERQDSTLCIGGLCLCRTNQVWDDTRKQCKQRVESSCSDSLDCAEGMYCGGKGEDDIDDKRCKCNEGLVQLDYSCHPPFGHPCDYKPGAGEEDYTKLPPDTRSSVWICDPNINSLRCIDGICKCQHSEYYDKENNTCRGLADSSCNFGMDTGNYCTPNAECRLPSGPDRYLGGDATCQCKFEFTHNEEDHCV